MILLPEVLRNDDGDVHTINGTNAVLEKRVASG